MGRQDAVNGLLEAFDEFLRRFLDGVFDALEA
jgi:hypothetical protein